MHEKDDTASVAGQLGALFAAVMAWSVIFLVTGHLLDLSIEWMIPAVPVGIILSMISALIISGTAGRITRGLRRNPSRDEQRKHQDQEAFAGVRYAARRLAEHHVQRHRAEQSPPAVPSLVPSTLQLPDEEILAREDVLLEELDEAEQHLFAITYEAALQTELKKIIAQERMAETATQRHTRITSMRQNIPELLEQLKNTPDDPEQQHWDQMFQQAQNTAADPQKGRP